MVLYSAAFARLAEHGNVMFQPDSAACFSSAIEAG